MRRVYPAITKKAPTLAVIENSASSVVIKMDNSWEALRGYYLEKVQELNNRLRELNIMENAREISTICHEITQAKKTLYKLNLKTGYLA